jgi:hypothetical protein
VTLGHQKTNTVRQENTLLHGETLLIVTTRDTENVTLEFVTERITRDFLGHTLIVETTATREKVNNVKFSICLKKLTDDVRLQFQSTFDSQ